MTILQNPLSRNGFGRARRVLLVGIFVVVVGLAAGIGLHFFRARPVPPTPPDAPVDETDPAVASAVRIARQRVLKAPRSAEAWGDLGKAFIANELEDQSQTCFAQAEQLDPSDPHWPYYQGGTLINRGDRQGAIPYLERAVERDERTSHPEDTPRLLLADTLLALGRGDEAEEHYRHVLDRHPDDPRAHFGLGLLASGREDWETSLRAPAPLPEQPLRPAEGQRLSSPPLANGWATRPAPTTTASNPSASPRTCCGSIPTPPST